MTIRLRFAGQKSIKVEDGLSLTVCVHKNWERFSWNGHRHCVQNVEKPWEALSLSQECTENFPEPEQKSAQTNKALISQVGRLIWQPSVRNYSCGWYCSKLADQVSHFSPLTFVFSFYIFISYILTPNHSILIFFHHNFRGQISRTFSKVLKQYVLQLYILFFTKKSCTFFTGGQTERNESIKTEIKTLEPWGEKCGLHSRLWL